MWNVVSFFTPAVPPILTSADASALALGRGFPAIVPEVNFAIIGFTYFVHLDVSFSIWFFTLLTMIQQGIFNYVGFTIPGRDTYTMGHPAIGWQAFGAMVVMVINLFWVARSHLRMIWRKAWSDDADIDDGDEIMSYRSIVIGAAFSMLYIVFWLWRSGMSPLGLSLFLLATIVIYTGITRVVMEGGLPFVRGPLIAQTFTGYALGGANMPVQSHMAFALSYTWHHELEGFFMAASANGSKITDHMLSRRAAVTPYIMLSAFLALLVSIVYALYMGYAFGAYNYGGWMFDLGSQVPYIEALYKHTEHYRSRLDATGVCRRRGRRHVDADVHALPLRVVASSSHRPACGRVLIPCHHFRVLVVRVLADQMDDNAYRRCPALPQGPALLHRRHHRIFLGPRDRFFGRRYLVPRSGASDLPNHRDFLRVQETVAQAVRWVRARTPAMAASGRGHSGAQFTAIGSRVRKEGCHVSLHSGGRRLVQEAGACPTGVGPI